MSKLKGSKAFTLIELLVVVAIIGILATIIIINVLGAQRRARVNSSLTNVNEALKAAATCLANESTLKVPNTGVCTDNGTSATCTNAQLTVGSTLICSDSTFSSTLWPTTLNTNYSYSVTFTNISGVNPNRVATGISDTGVTLTMPAGDLGAGVAQPTCNSLQCRLQ